MKLPDLPKKNKQEVDHGVSLAKLYAKQPIFNYDHFIEIKKCKDKNVFYFKQLEDLQVIKCLKIKYEGLLIRHTVATSNGTAGIPDYQWVSQKPVYIGIKYDKCWCFIDIDTFLLEKSKRKSLTEQRAKEISILSDSYKMN